MNAARPYRTQVFPENADDGCECYVPCVGGGEVDLVDKREAWPEWWCDPCGTRNDGWRWHCGMCGQVRGGADGLA